jgi:hypothetical protein
MTFKALLDAWAAQEKPTLTPTAYNVRLSTDDAARIHALAEIFDGVDEERIITDLLSAALDELQAAIPYEPGDKVIRNDEFDDPVYEDCGLTPRFLELARRHREALEKS